MHGLQPARVNYIVLSEQAEWTTESYGKRGYVSVKRTYKMAKQGEQLQQQIEKNGELEK